MQERISCERFKKTTLRAVVNFVQLWREKGRGGEKFQKNEKRSNGRLQTRYNVRTAS
jgi:hypothetical protein